MSRKPKTPKETKEKKERKPRQTLPKLRHPDLVDCRTPYTTKTMEELAPRLASALSAITAWKQSSRENRDSIPEFKSYVNLKGKSMSQTTYDRLIDSFNETGDVEVPNLYQPILVEYLRATNAQCVFQGSAKIHSTKPENWDTELLGEWTPGAYISGPPRLCHAPEIERMVDGAEVSEDDDGNEVPANIVTVGKHRYIVGTGNNAGSAMFLVSACDDGSYRAAYDARRALSFANKKGIANLVFQIQDAEVVQLNIASKGQPHNYVFFAAGSVATPGFLMDGDDQISTSQIRSGKTEGCKFVALPTNSDDWIGEAIPWKNALYPAIRESLGRNAISALRQRPTRSGEEADKPDVEGKIHLNSMVQMRLDPTNWTCLGFRSTQIGMVPFYRIVNGEECQGVALGHRLNNHLCVGMREYNRENVEVEEVVETPVEKPRRQKTEKSEKTEKTRRSRKTKSEIETPANESEVMAESPVEEMATPAMEEVQS